MDTGFLDQVVGAYISAFSRGFSVLHSMSLGLLGIVGSLAWGASFLQVIQAGMPLGGVIAHLVLVLLSFGVHVFLIVHMYDLAFALFNTFAQWGATAAGNGFSAADFLHPSTFWQLGFRITRPLIDFLLHMGGFTMLRNIGPIIMALIAILLIIGTFLWIAKDIIITIIEAHLCVMVLPILFPWAILTQTSEFAAVGIGWLMGVSVRALLIIAAVGTGAPLMEGLIPTFTAGGDPTLYSSLVMAGSALVFLLIVNQIVRQAERVAGRGYALGLPGATLMPRQVSTAAMTLVSGGAGAVISAASRAIQARRS